MAFTRLKIKNKIQVLSNVDSYTKALIPKKTDREYWSNNFIKHVTEFVLGDTSC